MNIAELQRQTELLQTEIKRKEFLLNNFQTRLSDRLNEKYRTGEIIIIEGLFYQVIQTDTGLSLTKYDEAKKADNFHIVR